MPEKTKPRQVFEKEDGEEAEKTFNPGRKTENTRSRDQQEKSYYYDDSHGYEIYNPDEEEDE